MLTPHDSVGGTFPNGFPVPATVYGHRPWGAPANRLLDRDQPRLKGVRSRANKERGRGDRFCVTSAAPGGITQLHPHRTVRWPPRPTAFVGVSHVDHAPGS